MNLRKENCSEVRCRMKKYIITQRAGPGAAYFTFCCCVVVVLPFLVNQKLLSIWKTQRRKRRTSKVQNKKVSESICLSSLV